ncbi:hypothetical protein TBR22_A16030 [Luteitalea sp. TBR-22]|nr:hypothetical protein TBR22_A16030 [Luteitalea sp. TBR-22]
MLSRAQEMRVFLGIVMQPLVVGVLAFVSAPLLLLDRSGRTLAGGLARDVVESALSVAVATSLLALIVALVGALPVAVWLLKRRQVSLFEACVYGVGLGNVPFVVGTALAGTLGLIRSRGHLCKGGYDGPHGPRDPAAPDPAQLR